jgi:hypothetical protein
LKGCFDGVHPDLDHFVLALLVGDQAAFVALVDLGDARAGFLEDRVFLWGDEAVAHGDRQPRAGRPREPDLLEIVKKLHGAV